MGIGKEKEEKNHSRTIAGIPRAQRGILDDPCDCQNVGGNQPPALTGAEHEDSWDKYMTENQKADKNTKI